MIIMKKIFSLVMAALFIVMMLPPAFAADAGIRTMKINPYGGSEGDIDTISWFSSSGAYFLFLPGDTDPAAAKVYYDASGDVKIDNTAITSGGSAERFTAGEHTLACGRKSYTLTVCFSSDIPSVFINTQSGSLSYIHQNKNNKEPGNIRVYENGEKTIDKELKQIKGRGNATWDYAKKPYNIKFDKKTGVLGMPKAKKWTLLAGCIFDNAFLKNYFALNFGRTIGLPETSECRHIDFYANGEYMGVYLVCESVEVGENRIDINDLDKANEDANPETEDLEALPQLGVRSGYTPGSMKWVDIPNSPENISGGYLLEVDYLNRYHAEPSGFISKKGMPVVIGSPEYASRAEVEYISSLWNEAEEALYSKTGRNSLGKSFTEYFDMESLVKCYIAEEVTKDIDSGITSFYFYKKANDDKFYAGPLWDFDHAMGSGTTVGDRLTIYEPDTWYANQLYRSSMDTACGDFPTFFAQCYSFSSFRTAVSEKWTQTVSAGFLPAVSDLSDESGRIQPSAVMNHLRWNTFGSTNAQTVSQKTESEANTVISFLTQRKSALDKGYSETGSVVIYNSNGGSGHNIYDAKIYSLGDTAVAKNNSRFSLYGFDFDRWNTEADGSGMSIGENESFTITDNYTVLYAQWKEGEPCHWCGKFHGGDSWQKIVSFFHRVFVFFFGAKY